MSNHFLGYIVHTACFICNSSGIYSMHGIKCVYFHNFSAFLRWINRSIYSRKYFASTAHNVTIIMPGDFWNEINNSHSHKIQNVEAIKSRFLREKKTFNRYRKTSKRFFVILLDITIITQFMAISCQNKIFALTQLLTCALLHLLRNYFLELTVIYGRIEHPYKHKKLATKIAMYIYACACGTYVSYTQWYHHIKYTIFSKLS